MIGRGNIPACPLIYLCKTFKQPLIFFMKTGTSFSKAIQQMQSYQLNQAEKKTVLGGGSPVISCITCTPGSPVSMPAVTTVLIRH
jgi:hypothetical protein